MSYNVSKGPKANTYLSLELLNLKQILFEQDLFWQYHKMKELLRYTRKQRFQKQDKLGKDDKRCAIV